MLVRTLTLTALVCACATTSLAAQTAAARTARPAPARPRLDVGADTNNPASYIQWATLRLRRNADEAAAGFYWATRLDPNNADAWYGLHVARLIARPENLIGWQQLDRAVLSLPEVKAIDSLKYRAQMVDPFFRESLDDVLLERYYVEFLMQRSAGRYSRAALEYDIRNLIDRSTDEGDRAWLAATRGDYNQAVRYLAVLTRRYPRNFWIRAYRARVFMQLGNADSAVVDMRGAIEAARAADTTRMWHVYDSKEALEYSLGWIMEQRGDTTGARDAYQRALVENLGYWPAHVRLGTIALARRDTAVAFREFQAAIDVKEDDFNARLMMGFALGSAGRFADAIPHLVRATEIEPHAAAGYDMLAQILDAAGNRAAAIGAYERFLARASQSDPGRGPVEQRLATLRGR